MAGLVAASVAVGVTPVPVAYAENWVLQLGPLSGFPRSGTAPFDASTASPVPSPFTADQGNDANNSNQVVRSGDTQLYAWSLTASNVDSDAATATTVNGLTLTQVITPDPVGTAPGLGIGVDDLEIAPLNPAECPGAGSGIFTNTPVGSITVVCNTGPASTGEQTTVTVRVRPRGTAPNGARFTSTQSVSATQTNSTPVSPVVYDLDTHPQTKTIYITNRPEWNLSKHGFLGGSAVIMDPDGAGPEAAQRGVQVTAVYQISSDRPFGNEALSQPITVHDLLTITDNLGGYTPIAGAEYWPISCSTNGNWGPGIVQGADSSGAAYSIQGPWQDCTSSVVRDVPGDATSGFSFTFPEIDFDPASYPTVYTYGGSLTAGPFFVASIAVHFFIPKDTIDLGDGVATDNGGTIQVFNAVGDFDPDSPSGGSNFNAGVEPGYCSPTENGVTSLCDAMPGTGTRSDNVIGPTPFTYSEPGFTGFTKDTWRNRYNYLPGQTYNKSGDGLVEPTMKWFHRVFTYNGSFENRRGYVCDVFDNTTAVLTTIDTWYNPNDPSMIGQYAILNPDNTPPAFIALNVIEYGHVDLSAIDTMVSYNMVSDRWNGDWGALNTEAAGCADDDAPIADPASGQRWFTDPNAVPGGIDAVNIIRVRPIDGTVDNIPAQNYLMLHVPLQARETFNGGPHNGEPVPDGTVIANVGNRMYDPEPSVGLEAVGYLPAAYSPEPFSYYEWGERVTVRRAVLNVLKRSVAVDTGYDDNAGDPIVSGAASNYDVTGNGVAGDLVVWEITPTVVSELAGGSDVTNVTLTDVLPAGVEYDPVCTSFVNGGTNLPSAAQLNTPGAGQTTLTWLLGTQQTNANLGTFKICTVTDDFASNGTTFTNQVTFRADGLGSDTDTHTITVAQSSRVKIKKTVDAPLDLLDDDEVWTLQIRNFSDLVNPQTPVLLEVYPWNGDATSNNGGLRNPPSDFDGTNVLMSMPIATKFDGTTPQSGAFWFTNQAPGLINQDPDGNLAGALTTWCSTPDAGTTWVYQWGPGTVADCPADLADTTGFMFRADTDLAVVGDAVNSGIKVTFTLDATGNTPDNIYTNRFSADSPTFPSAQFLRSNIVTVRTVGFQLGDYVWVDGDGDGKLDVSEPPVPDGVIVELYLDDDGVPGPSAGDTLLGDTTTAGGVYQFTGLAAGDYYVRIPATEFATGGPLEGWDITAAAPEAETPDSDANDTVGHDGYVDGADVTVGGIVSNVITLSAQEVGGNLVGDEPLLDNTHGLVVDPFQDGFQNFTLDLAVVGPPGIDLTKDVCTATSAADCEAGDANWDADMANVPYGSTAYWRITVTNTGAQDLSPVVITDPVTPSCNRTLSAPLKVGQSVTYVCAGAAVTESPSSPRVNVATVVGNPQAWDPTNTDPDDNVTADDDAAIATTAVSIGDYVWMDNDRDGQQESGEPGLGGVTVQLWNADGTSQLDSTTTDGTGFYVFTDLDPGADYLVIVVPPADHAFTLDDSGADTTDSDADGNGEIPVTTPTVGTNGATAGTVDGPDFDAGLVSLDLTLTKELTATGPFYPGSTVTFELTPHNEGPSTALAGWSVTDVLPAGLTLVSIAGSGSPSGYTCVLATATCTAAGPLAGGADGETIVVTATIAAGAGTPLHNVAYVSPASGEVTEVNPLDVPTTDDDTSSTATNNDAQADVSVDSLISVGDHVWLDVDRDGQQDSGEPAVGGITVNLYDATGITLLDSTTTDAVTGFYVFTDLLPNTSYVVEFVAPGYSFTGQFQPGGVSTDSNANPATGRANVLTPATGANGDTAGNVDEPTIDAGLVQLDLTITKNVLTAGPFAPGQQVQFELVPENLGPAAALAGWSVTDVLPGQLTLVSIAGAAGGSSIYTCTLATATCTASVPLAAGATGEAIIVTVTINGTTAGSAKNVAYVSPAGTEVAEINPLEVPTTDTDTEGSDTNNDAQATIEYMPTGTIGDTVFVDFNGNGTQDPGDPGLEGYVVQLEVDYDGDGSIDDTFTDTTDANGNYLFDQLPPGTYTVTVLAPPANASNSADPDGGADSTSTLELGLNEDNLDQDFGYTPGFTLGNQVWADVNGDGIYQAGTDIVYANITVELWLPGGVAPIQSVTTNANGQYAFTGLPAGDYFVRIPPAEFVAGDVVGFVAAPGGQIDPDNNEDDTDDHNAFAGVGGETISGVVTQVITLSAHVELQSGVSVLVGDEGFGSADPFTNFTLDLALVGPVKIDIVKEVCNPAAGGGSCDPAAALGADGWNDVSYNATFMEDITWRITVRNTGVQNLSSIVVTDPLVAACATPAAYTPPATLAPGASFSYTCVTNDLIVGFTNTATVTGSGPDGTQVTDNDPATVTTPNPVPGIEMEKYVVHTDYPTVENDADTAPGIHVPVGDQVTWVYDVFLPAGANVPLRNVTVSDNGGPNPTFSATYQSGDTDGDNLLDPGETWRFVAPANLTVTAGQYTNIATAQGTPVSPANQTPIADQDPANHFGVNAAILVIKYTNNQDANTPYGPIIAPDGAVTWRYLVRNTGNVPLVDVTVVDDQGVTVDCGAADADGDGDIDFLAVGVANQVNCLGNGTAEPGQYTNIATATGTPSDSNGTPLTDAGGNPLPQPTDTDPSNYFSPQPSVDIVKTTQTIDSNVITGPFVGTGLNVLWTYTVTNTGNTALRNVTVTDDQIAADATIDCDGDNVIALMVPGQVETCTVYGTAIEGQYQNTGSVTGQPVMPTVAPSDPNDPDTFPTDPAAYSPVVLTGTTTPLANVTDSDPDHYFGANPSIDLTKYTNEEDANEPYGPFVLHPDTVTWTYRIENTGNTALTNVTLSDDMIDEATISCDALHGDAGGDNVIALMLPGDVVWCTATGGSDPGQYANIGTVVGDPAFPDASFNDDPGFDPDDASTWPTDPASFDPILLTDTTGETSPVDPVGDDDPSHYFGAEPGVDIVKTTQTLDNDTIVGPFVELGNDVLWTYTITNTGNTALSNVTLVDDMIDEATIECEAYLNDLNGDNVIDVLFPGSSVVCTALGVAEPGQYENVGDVTGDPTMPDQDSFDDPSFDPDDPDTWPTDPAEFDPVVVDGEPLPAETDTNPDHYFGVVADIEVVKSTNTVDADTPFGPFVAVDGAVVWTYDVTNTGNVALANVVLSDDMVDETDIDCGEGDNTIALLLPGQTITCTASGTATAGQYANVADVVGEPVFPDPSHFDDEGFDPDDASTWPTDPEAYDPIVTTDTAGETTPMDPVTDDNPSHYYGTEPGVQVVKSTNGQDANSPKGPFIPEGSTVTWTFAVTNTGNTALVDVTVTDDKIADDATAIDCGTGTNVIALLLPGQTVTCTATAPAVEGQYANIGDGTGDAAMPDPETPGLDPDDPSTWPTTPDTYTPIVTTNPDGSTSPVPNVTDDDPSHYFGAAPAIEIVKQVCNQANQALCDIANDAHWVESTVITQGTLATWRITVRNTGNVDLAPVTVTDPLSPSCDRTFPSIPVGGSERYTCTIDPVPGQLTNVATATGNPVDDDGDDIIDPDTDEPMDDVTDDDDAYVQLPPDVTVTKVSDKTTVTKDSVVTFTLTAVNQGLGPAAGVVAVDTLPEGMVPTVLPPSMTYNATTRQLTWTIGTLAPGASVQAQYTVKVTKVGTLVNVVVVESETPGDPPDNNDDDTPVVVTPPVRIPDTGSDVAPILWSAAGLVLGGLGIVLGTTRRRRRAHA